MNGSESCCVDSLAGAAGTDVARRNFGLELSPGSTLEPSALLDLALDLEFHTADVLDNFGRHVATGVLLPVGIHMLRSVC